MRARTARTSRPKGYSKRHKTLWQQYHYGTFNERQTILTKLQTGVLTFAEVEATK